MRKQGFSLIEIICVFCLMGILLALSFPLEQHFFENSKMDMIQSQLLNEIQWARSAAIIQGQPIFLCGSVNQKNCSDQWKDGFLMYSHEKIIDYVKNPFTHGTLYFRSFPVHQPYLNFFPSGIDNMQNGTFWYCESRASHPRWAIMLSQSGRARVVRTDGIHRNIVDSQQRVLECAN